MLTPSRRLEEPGDPVQERRVLLHQAGTTLRNMVAGLLRLSLELESRSLGQAIPLVEEALEKVEAEHAEIDCELLVACVHPWSHPVQAVDTPRAPFGRVAALCLERLAEARGEELERLTRIHQRVDLAHQFAETARRRRLERCDWLRDRAES